jgi:quercetin dioxygenase-like cupin family protein
MLKHSLDALARHQLEAASASATGRASRTIFGGHEQVLRQTVIALCAGRSLGEHQNPGEATVHVLLGRVRLVAGDKVWEGRRGDLLIVPPDPHRLDADADSVVLLTVAKVTRPHRPQPA